MISISDPADSHGGHAAAPRVVRDQDIVCFSSIDWDSSWQTHQEIMSALARAGNRVLFVENTGVRRPALSDLPRLVRRMRNWRARPESRELPTNLRLLSPLIPPFPYSRLALPINVALLGRSLRRHLRDLGMERPIVWTFLPTPLIVRLARALDPRLIIYHCADDFSSSSAEAWRIARSEEHLLRAADLVFVTAARLEERGRRFSTNVHLLPAGVAFERFERVRVASGPLPADLRSLPRPIVGYVGGLQQWLDQQLLVEVARRLPSYSFALVGPTRTDVSLLARCRNIHLLGARPHDAVPHYVKGFDVAMIPYRLTTYTDHVYPVKLNEYLAMGVPVVSTDLVEIRRFVAEYGDVATIARTPDAFIEALRTAVADRDPERRMRRIETARQNSWSSRIDRMSGLVEAALAARAAPGVAQPGVDGVSPQATDSGAARTQEPGT